MNNDAFNDFLKMSCKSFHMQQTMYIPEVKIRCVLFREDAKKTNKKLIKFGITVTENDMVGKDDNTPTTQQIITSIRKEFRMAFVLASGGYHLRMV